MAHFGVLWGIKSKRLWKKRRTVHASRQTDVLLPFLSSSNYKRFSCLLDPFVFLLHLAAIFLPQCNVTSSLVHRRTS
jgi:hypothetical protein